MILYQEYEGLDVVREWWTGTPVTVFIIRQDDGRVIHFKEGFPDKQYALNYAINYIGAITADW